MRTLQLILIISAFLMGFGCSTLVEVDLPDRPPKLTVNAFLVEDTNVAVSVFSSLASDADEEFKPVNNAMVTIADANGKQYTSNQLQYVTSLGRDAYVVVAPIKVGQQYTVSVSAPGFDTVIAVTELPAPVDILEIDTSSVLESFGGETFRTQVLGMSIQDPAQEQNYYQLKFYSLMYYPDTTDGNMRFNPIVREVYASPSANGVFAANSFQRLIFSDELFDGQRYHSEVNYYADFNAHDTADISHYLSVYLVAELRSLSRDYYDFQVSYESYLNNGGPFSQPVQVYSNVSGGFGIVAGFSSDFDTIQLSEGILPSPLDP